MGTTRVSFYVLSGAETAARLGYACRLAEKAYKLRNRIHAHAGDAGMAQALDVLLWTFRQGSFVPHEMLTPASQLNSPITIGFPGIPAPTEPPPADLLINLAVEVPAFFTRYARVAEIVDSSPASREAGRARHRFYRDQGLQPETHEVS
jgi:DNA polymerase III subunit chi